MPEAIIFDFDGVVADTEVLANRTLAEMVTELGVPTTLEDAYRIYKGKRFHEVLALVETNVGRAVPGFGDAYMARALESFRRELRPVAGVREFIARFDRLPRCIASNSLPERVALCLEVLDMTALFPGGVFSASDVVHGKPSPDIFLHAAARMGVQPERCIVIEDSVLGVVAARAAGATVIGLLAGSHMQPGDRALLLDAGAHHVAADYDEAAQVMNAYFSELERPLSENGFCA